MTKLNVKDFIKAGLQGIVVVVGTPLLSGVEFISSLPLGGTEIPVIGITVLNTLVATALVIGSSLILSKVDALR